MIDPQLAKPNIYELTYIGHMFYILYGHWYNSFQPTVPYTSIEQGS